MRRRNVTSLLRDPGPPRLPSEADIHLAEADAYWQRQVDRLTAERDAALRRAEAWKSAHSLADAVIAILTLALFAVVVIISLLGMAGAI